MAVEIETLIGAMIVIVIIFGVIFFFGSSIQHAFTEFFGKTEQEQFGQFVPSAVDFSKFKPAPSGQIAWPVPTPEGYQYFFSSCFGHRHPSSIDASNCHPGVDIAAAKDSPVLAAASGNVVREGIGGMSECMHIESGAFITRYCHVNPTRGNGHVDAGQQIGTIKLNHVHFEYITKGAIQTSKLSDLSSVCLPEEKEDYAIFVFANPRSVTASYSWVDSVQDRSPHLNPFCFFTQEIQKQIGHRERDVSCLLDTGGIEKGCSSYFS